MIRKTKDMKNRAIRSPILLGTCGALLGIGAARLIRSATAGSRKERIEWRPVEAEGSTVTERIEEGASTMVEGVKDVAGDIKERTIETASHLRERAAEVAGSVRERLPSGPEARRGARKVYRFATDEQPVVGAVFALCLGMALGFLIPVATRERKLLEPLKKQAVKSLGDVGEKVEEVGQRLGERIAGEEAPEEEEEAFVPPFDPNAPALH